MSGIFRPEAVAALVLGGELGIGARIRSTEEGDHISCGFQRLSSPLSLFSFSNHGEVRSSHQLCLGGYLDSDSQCAGATEG